MIWWDWLKSKMNAFYDGIIQSIPNPFNRLSTLTFSASTDKKNLNNLRNKHFDLIQEESKKSNKNYYNLTKIITKDTKQFVSNIIAQEEKKLGPPPCEYSVFTLGSMAREETGPVTDLEIGILIEEKNVENTKYFYELSQRIADRLFLLGEHPNIGKKGLRMDEADNAPPHRRFFARNMTNEQTKQWMQDAIRDRQFDKIPYEGSRPYLTTPEEFSSFTDPNYHQNKDALKQAKSKAFKREWNKALQDPKNTKLIKTKEGKAQLKNEIDFWLDEIYRPYNARELRIASEAGTATGRNIDLFCGNRNIFNKFKQEKNRYLNLKVDHQLTHRQNIAVQCIRGDIQKQLSKTNNILTTGKLDKKLDIKRELYRFGEQFITNLGFYYGCKNQNTIDIVIELKNRKVINETTANKLIDYMKFAHEMRLKEQAVLKRQGFAVYFDQDKFNEDKKALEDELASLQNVIDYMSKLYHVDAEELSTKKREYEHLKSDLEHLKEMDAKKIFSKEDIERLKSHYVPLGKEIFEIAKKWSDNQQLSRAAPAATTPVIKTISPAWAHFKVQNKNKRKRLPKVIAKLFKFRKI